MTIPTGAVLYTAAYGSRPEGVEIPVIATRAPTSSDIRYEIGKRWVNTSGNAAYELTSISTVGGTPSANWIALGGGSVDLSTLTGDSGGAISPSSGNINVLGTANQITTTGSGSTVTWSLPNAITAPGSLATTTSLTAGSGFTVSAGAVTVTTGTSAINISADAAATALNIGTGAAAKTVILGSTNTTSATTVQAGSGGISMTGVVTLANNLILNGNATQMQMQGGAVTDFIGTATLVAGTVTVANTNIAAGDVILVTRAGANGSTAVGVFNTSISAATSFTITSLNPTDGTTQTNDVSTVKYVIIRQI